jgi:glycosyltransferase involved in cell wall biosynthesis
MVRRRRIIGYWAWELPLAPDTWRACLPFMHEIWATSHFTADALRKLLPRPHEITVRAVPPPVAVAPPEPSRLDRAAFGLPDDAVVILSSFNLASSFERKNPLGAIAAHRQAFGNRADRILVLKVGHPHHAPEDFARLQQAVTMAPNIRIDARNLPAADHHALMGCADIVLSLHRSEGFGLVPAEAMLLGRPVIATGWSGNLEFMDDTSAALVGYRLVPARDPRGVYNVPGAVWADPDLADAVAQLRRLADDPIARTSLGARGQAMAKRSLGPAPLAHAVRALGLPVAARQEVTTAKAPCPVIP